MIEQEKQLLIKDLCCRLPYKVKIEANVCPRALFPMDVVAENLPKPYLRPMSSMTEEEIEEYIRLLHKDCIDVERPAHCCKNSITAVVVTLTSRDSVRYWYNDIVSIDTIDFLNSRHFDWRGLIPMGLALEAPENMYKF